jgi:hydrophobe/amphiphile efflux-1 (HAE1) family protein
MFSAIFIKRPRFAIVISLFTILTGMICVFKLPVAEYPQVASPTIVVSAAYPGAGAQVIADTVAAPIEAEINGVEDLIYYSSQSDNMGNYTLTLTFKPDADENMALVNVNNAIKRAEHSLPSEVVSNGLTSYKRSSDFLGIIAVYSDNPEHTPLFLSNYASIHMKDAIARLDGVGQAIIFGAQDYSMRLWLDPYRMKALSVGYSDILNAVSSQNVQAATGSVGTESSSPYMQFKVDTKGRLTSPEEFANIIVKSGEGGRQVRLRDVARIELGAESYSGLCRLDGRPAVVLAVFKLNDANALKVMNNVKSEMDVLKRNFPEGMTWTTPYDSTEFVVMTMKEIVETLVLTFVLVVLITWIFLQDWRATVIPALTIPVSLIGTFVFLFALDMSINTLTMFALILAIGSVVDDAIVVTENCVRLIDEEGMKPFDAAMKSMQQISNALVATTLVVVAVYAPIAFFGGMVGKIYMQFAITMCVALCLSLVNALTLSPALCAVLLRRDRRHWLPLRAFFKVVNIGLAWLRSLYLFVGALLVRHPIFTTLAIGAILYGNYYVFNSLPSSFLPQEDKGTLFCEVVLAPGTSLPKTEAVLADVGEMVQGLEGVNHVVSVPGRSFTAGNGENVGMLFLDLDSWSKRKTPELQLSALQAEITKLGAAIPDATVTVFAPPAISGLGNTGGVTFALQATGNQTYQDLSQTANSLMGKIMGSKKAIYAFTSLDAHTPMLHLEIDRAKAEAMNVPVSAVFSTLQTQLGSLYINDFNMFGKTYKVKMQAEAEFRENLNAIERLHVTSNTGNVVPMDALATVSWSLGPRQAERFNMFPSANINTQGVPFFSSGEMMKLIQNIVDKEFPNDYQISWTDMSYQESQNEGKVVGLLVLSLLMAYLFLVAQYESWTVPISVMLSVATATLGGMLALKWTGMSMNIYCQLGLLMLIGLTAKTSILMVEFSKQDRENGASIRDAAMNGMKIRFRSVMMTAVSFLFGIFPMVIASGAGAGSRHSIGITTFWGMMVATIVGMMFIPGLYSVFQYLAEGTYKLLRITPREQRGELK